MLNNILNHIRFDSLIESVNLTRYLWRYVMEYLLGIDVGSSSVKAAILDANSGTCAGSAFYPKKEQIILAPEVGFAEQDPHAWYAAACDAIKDALHESSAKPEDIKAIGIAYQMHGLVCVDSNHNVLRPAIILCDSRAVSYGESAFSSIGKEECLSRMMNSPGNFTASKLAEIKNLSKEDLIKKTTVNFNKLFFN